MLAHDEQQGQETEPYLPTPAEELRLPPWRRGSMTRFSHSRAPAYSYGSLGQRKGGPNRLGQASFGAEATDTRLWPQRVIFSVFAVLGVVGVIGAIVLASMVALLTGSMFAPATPQPGITTLNIPTQSASKTRTPAVAPGGGFLSGALARPPARANLTTLATSETSDWAHWGLTGSTDFDHRASGDGQISNYTVIGGGHVHRYATANVAYTWSDGQPTTSASASTTGVYVIGAGDGFSLTVPADTTTRTLTIYVEVYRAQGVLTASLSDDSASQYADASLSNPNGALGAAYTITYQAASANQQLTIIFSVQTNYVSGGYVALQAATLN